MVSTPFRRSSGYLLVAGGLGGLAAYPGMGPGLMHVLLVVIAVVGGTVLLCRLVSALLFPDS